MSNELFKTIEAQGKLITELRAELENRKVYAVHVMDSLLDYSEQKLFTNYMDAVNEFRRAVNEAESNNRIIEIYSQSDEHLYYEGDESSVKIFIENLIINQ
jgi:hypothetical protein|tara:strand:+ start:413 stop:715 length:303 start_codon:yes stop_codon:yes gene_type:complete